MHALWLLLKKDKPGRFIVTCVFYSRGEKQTSVNEKNSLLTEESLTSVTHLLIAAGDRSHTDLRLYDPAL